MISHRTVFLVGAGGSVPYNFQSGPAMLATARNQTADLLHHIIRKHHDLSKANEFRKALIASESSSIDAVLEHRTDLDEIGRLYIASKILETENGNRNVHPTGQDWLSYLFEQMDTASGVEGFGNNRVTFITYNYDRLIESRIADGLRARYKATDKQLSALWDALPVIHLHGSVGSLNPADGLFIPFGARGADEPIGIDDAITRHIKVAANQIKVVHQADGKSPEFVRARNLLMNAQRVIFLGFSFGRTNVDRLDFKNIHPEARVICGRYGMTEAEWNVLVGAPFTHAGLPSPLNAGAGADCLQILRNHVGEIVSRY